MLQKHDKSDTVMGEVGRFEKRRIEKGVRKCTGDKFLMLQRAGKVDYTFCSCDEGMTAVLLEI